MHIYLQQFARILRAGGLAGITDVTVTDAGLRAELTTVTAWVACIADARSVIDYTASLVGAGLRTRTIESHDDCLLRMISRIEARIAALRIGRPPSSPTTALTPMPCWHTRGWPPARPKRDASGTP
ncbi:hypothetical protein [Mycobacterium riyadhense]|uniref:Uncharacterized protein n=1 Tax=Mycobacterium riyadhense TaxID=486698 RepID=A0A653EDI0_9MYCO|nr:hypothetical protein [Mycobacterium riyadhense]VTO94930.1 hypothetical protein BIN_B_00404 [Mycobacterium riyadhense]